MLILSATELIMAASFSYRLNKSHFLLFCFGSSAMEEIISSYGTVINLFSIISLLLLLLVIFRPFNGFFLSRTKSPLPPGPKPWPIFGNIFHLGKNPHISFAGFAEAHGPLISLWLGSQLVVVGSSPAAAAAILKTHDRNLCGRDIPNNLPYRDSALKGLAIVWTSECSEQWKFFRSLCKSELFSAKAMASQVGLRETKLREMMNFLAENDGKVVNIGEILFVTLFNIMNNLFFSKDGIDFGDEMGSGLKGTVLKLTELGNSPDVSDFYPYLAWLDIQGLRRSACKLFDNMCSLWKSVINDRRKSHGQGFQAQQDFLDCLIANGLRDDQMTILFFELFVAGSDTQSSTIEWAMAELLKNKEAMKRLQEELKTEISGNSINESDISKLPYLQACIKETLRLHPPAPLLVPHRALEDCEIMNYKIPKDTRIFVNVWAIGRDGLIWEEPSSFKPERFLCSDVDFSGNDFEFIPFGSGRRICPGLPMASRQLPLILASLLHCFDWDLPNGEDCAKIDMTEKFGLTLHKEQPLQVISKTKSYRPERLNCATMDRHFEPAI